MSDQLDIKPDYPDIVEKHIERAENIFGLFQTVSAAPTATPKNWFGQIVYYKSGGTLRLYIYDVTNHTWSYTALT